MAHREFFFEEVSTVRWQLTYISIESLQTLANAYLLLESILKSKNSFDEIIYSIDQQKDFSLSNIEGLRYLP